MATRNRHLDSINGQPVQSDGPNNNHDYLHVTDSLNIYGADSHSEAGLQEHLYESVPYNSANIPSQFSEDAINSGTRCSVSSNVCAQQVTINPTKKFPFVTVSKKCWWLLFAGLLVCAVVLIAVCAVYYDQDRVVSVHVPVESVLIDLRVTCTPELRGRQTRTFSAEMCRKRGCEFNDTALPSVDDGRFGPPSCYMHPQKVGYHLINSGYEPGNWTRVAILEAIHKPIIFNESRTPMESDYTFRMPAFRSDYLTEDTLRFQFYDKGNPQRYQVPLKLKELKKSEHGSHRYGIHVTSTSPFAFEVFRRDAGFASNAVIDTSMGGLVLQNQFLQFTTKLPSEHFFGLGDNRHGALKRKMDWSTWAMFNRDVDLLMINNPTSTTKNLYGFQPFYMVIDDGGKAHGVYLHNSNAMDYTLLPGKAITWRTIGGILDFYIFFGPTPEEVVQQYTKLVGRTFMPPYWALGFHIGSWGIASSAQSMEIAQRNMDMQIPFDMIFVDFDYMDERQPFTTSRNYSNFHNVTNRMKNEKGIHYGGIIFPTVHADAANSALHPYNDALAKDILVTMSVKQESEHRSKENQQKSDSNVVLFGKAWAQGRSAFIDYLNPKATDWLQKWLTMQNSEQAMLSAYFFSVSEPSCFATNLPAEDAWFIAGRIPDVAAHDEPSIPGFGKHLQYTLKCSPDSTLERPPYKPAAIRNWETAENRQLSDDTICTDAQHRDGTQTYNHYDVHNIYGLTVARAAYRASRNVHSHRMLIMATASYPGIQQYAGRWFGDIPSDMATLRYSFQWILEYNLFGNPFAGMDVCGILIPPQSSDARLPKELCHRWTIAGAFYPFMRTNSANTNQEHDPAQMFQHTPAFLDEVRKALNLRYQLMPYLYTLFHIAHTRGNTVMRPLFHEYVAPDVIKFAEQKQVQFFWGPALMITPVLTVQEGIAFIDRTVITFPRDTFYDFFTGDVYNRNNSTSMAPETYLLRNISVGLHGRAGHIIITQSKNGRNTRESRKNNFTVLVFPKLDEYSYGEFFWDDGEFLDTYENGNYFAASIRYKGQDSVIYPRIPYGYWHVLIWEVSHNNYSDMADKSIEKIKIYGMEAAASHQVLIDNLDRTQDFVFFTESSSIMNIVGALPMNRNFTLLFTNDAKYPANFCPSASTPRSGNMGF